MRHAPLVLVPAVLVWASTAGATTYDIGPADDLFGTLQGLVPGDEVIIHAGTYTTPGFFEVTWAGNEVAPIVVRGADGELPVIAGDPSQNVINLAGAYFTLRNVEITGGSHGIRLASAYHATLEDLVLHQLGDVGISCNRPGEECDSLTIRHCEIYDTGLAGTGEGMYLGCNDSGCEFHHSVVEGNFVHDLGGTQGDGIEVKTGAYANVIRDNVIVNAIYPGITMYGFGFAMPGSNNVVERNLVWGSQDNGIQIVGQIVVRNNVVIGAVGNGIHSKPSQGFDPTDLSIVNNTIYGAGSACIKGNQWPAGSGQIVANNAVYCETSQALSFVEGIGTAVFASNVGLGTSDVAGSPIAGAGALADLGNPDAAATYPPPGSSLVDAGSAAQAPPDDFNGTLRADGAPDVGAYEVTTPQNPGWTPIAGFKDDVASIGGAGGGGGAGGATGGSGGTGNASGGQAGQTTGSGASTGPGGSSGGGPKNDASCGCRIPSEPRAPFALVLPALLLLRRRRQGCGSPM